jgi:hypothetical protein
LLASLPLQRRQKFLASLTEEEAALLNHDWTFWARDEQLPPLGAWTWWLVLAGRGFGKTRTGAEWVRLEALSGRRKRLALVAPTAADSRDVMVEGESGILAISAPWERPLYEPSKRRLTWPNGAIATLFSAEDPDALRGPQFDGAWCDETAAWKRQEATWDMLQFGMRLGSDPRGIVTTTPRPTVVVRQLVKRADVVVTRGKTRDNAANLAKPFLDTIVARYEGTRLGRQELDGEILDGNPDALWSHAMLDRDRISPVELPDLQRIVVAVDPPATSGEKADECGIVVAGLAGGVGYVLADHSARGLKPAEWADRAVKAFKRFNADRIVVEINNGGEMVEHTIRQVDKSVPVRTVHASRGKVTRAEPISALYEQGRVHHVGTFAALEDQMAEFTPDFDRATMGYSPDRVDALVWALTDLMLGRQSEPSIRSL